MVPAMQTTIMERIRKPSLATLAFAAAVDMTWSSMAASVNNCGMTSRAAFQSCKLGAASDTKLALGKCANITDATKRKACNQQATADGKDALQSCRDQNTLRQGVCGRLGPSAYAPVITPTNFTTTIDNQFFPLPPGTTYVFEGMTEDGFEHDEFAVTHTTKSILGVLCVEVHDTRTVDNKVLEDTRDWFAQDLAGNVWYFGENTAIVDGGKALGDGGLPVDLSGTWTAGLDGAVPGIVMKAHPMIGDFYRQEFFLGEAEDLAEVKSLTESVTVPIRPQPFDNCLKTEESSPLAPGDVESKLYAQGFGLLRTVEANGDHVDLVEIRTGQ